jgi:homoserine/homoserine lactone efflux protein
MTLQTWFAFLVAAWLISLAPGPGAVSTMASAAHFGVRRTLFNLIGLELGLVFVLLAVASGLGAIVVASATAFMIVKWLGVAYLLYLGVRQFRSHTGDDRSPESNRRGLDGTPRSLILQGFLVNASNPKGIVFMLAVLPQFIDPDRGQVPQYALCGITFIFTDVVVMNGYAFFASRTLRLLRSPKRSDWINRAFGSLYVGAAGLLAAFGRHS